MGEFLPPSLQVTCDFCQQIVPSLVPVDKQYELGMLFGQSIAEVVQRLSVVQLKDLPGQTQAFEALSITADIHNPEFASIASVGDRVTLWFAASRAVPLPGGASGS